MRIPAEIKGNSRLRALDICRLYIEGKTPEEIKAERNYPITVRRIQQILSENSDFVSKRIAWSKSKRIQKLQRIAEGAGEKISSRKDVLDVLKELRAEIEGDKALIDQSKHTHVTYVWKTDGKNNTDRLLPAGVPDGNPQVESQESSGGYRAAWRENGSDDQRADSTGD